MAECRRDRPRDVQSRGADVDQRDWRIEQQVQDLQERSNDLRRAPSVDQLCDFSLIFVTRPMIGNLPGILDQVGRNATLVVADSPSATTRGAMLNMDILDGRVSFSANLASAGSQNLDLSARLLSLATEVVR